MTAAPRHSMPVQEETPLVALWRAIFDKDEDRAIAAIERGAPVHGSWLDLTEQGPLDPKAANLAWRRRLRQASDGMPPLESLPLGERDALAAAASLRLPRVVERLIERQDAFDDGSDDARADLRTRREKALRVALAGGLPIHGWSEERERFLRVADRLLAALSEAPWLADRPDDGSASPWLAATFRLMNRHDASEPAWFWLGRHGALASQGARDALSTVSDPEMAIKIGVQTDAVGKMAVLVRSIPSLGGTLDAMLEKREKEAQIRSSRASASAAPLDRHVRASKIDAFSKSFAQRVRSRLRLHDLEASPPAHALRDWARECARGLARGDMPAAVAAGAEHARLMDIDQSLALVEQRDFNLSLSWQISNCLPLVWDLGVGRDLGPGASAADIDQAWERLVRLVAEPERGGQGWPDESAPETASDARQKARASFWHHFVAPPTQSAGVDGEREAMSRAGLFALESGLFDRASFWQGLSVFDAELSTIASSMERRGGATGPNIAAIEREAQRSIREALAAALPALRRSVAASGLPADTALAEPLRRRAAAGHWRTILCVRDAGLAQPGELDLSQLTLIALRHGRAAGAERLLLAALEDGLSGSLAPELPEALAEAEACASKSVGSKGTAASSSKGASLLAAMARVRRLAQSVIDQSELRGVVAAASASTGPSAQITGDLPLPSPAPNLGMRPGAGSAAGAPEPAADRSRKRL
jgi:hypothetical protein